MKRQVLILGLFASGALGAAGWADFSPAFPPLPCSDGWAGCVVDGRSVTPDMQPDSKGRPMPADLRLGWFDLQPTATFSPFVHLSEYPERGEPPTPAPAPPPVVAAAEPPPSLDLARNDAVPEASPRPTPIEPPRRSLFDFGSPDPPPVVPPPQPVAEPYVPPPVPYVPPTPVIVETPQPVLPPPVVEPEPEPVRPPVVVAEPEPVGCDDLVSLEPAALMGQLSATQRSCLDGRIQASGRQTEKDKLSRVLLMDAEARGDKKNWADLMKRHLEDIDRSDPDLCFKYAIYLAKGGVSRSQGVIRWADYALENKSAWSGSTYTSRVYALLKLRAEAANSLWQAAEQAYVADRSEENEQKAARNRGITKDYSREWLDYAKASGQDTKNALALCVSAAGNRDFCGG